MPATLDAFSLDRRGIDLTETWPIETPYVRARCRRKKTDGRLKVYRPERRVVPAQDRYDGVRYQWASFHEMQGGYRQALREEHLPDVIRTLHVAAARQLIRDEESRKERRREPEAQEERRADAQAELRRWITMTFVGLRPKYHDDPPLRYRDGESTRVPFWRWVPGQLSAKDAKQLSVKKDELRDRYDLAPHRQLM